MNWSKPVLVAGLSLSCLSLRALTIKATYDSSVTTNANAAQIESAFGTAVQVLQTLYTNPITVNITVYWDGSSLGESSGNLTGNPTYAQLVTALSSARTTTADSNAVKSLPASDPVPGTNHVWWIPRPEAKALNMTNFIVSQNDTNQDGWVQFAATTWTFDPNNRAVPGAFDFISVAEHEITEVLGRTSDLGQNPPGGYVPLDLFHYTASNTRTFVTNLSGAYLSINNGTNVLKYFSTTSDPQDWLSPSSPADSFDAYLTAGYKGLLSLADLTELDILGYALNFKAPRLKAAPLTNGNFELTFTNVSGLNFGVVATTNLTSAWVNLGTATESTAGHYQFIDTQTSANKKRFYAAVLQ